MMDRSARAVDPVAGGRWWCGPEGFGVATSATDPLALPARGRDAITTGRGGRYKYPPAGQRGTPPCPVATGYIRTTGSDERFHTNGTCGPVSATGHHRVRSPLVTSEPQDRTSGFIQMELVALFLKL
ncbi:unnamed protein product, partial [Iphiclides podalirius]